MTPDKAAEILSLYIAGTYPTSYDDLTDAFKLGNEALKRINLLRIDPYTYVYHLLPGETND